MLNKVTLIGNLGSDPEIKSFQSGDRYAQFSLATSESWKDKATGERKQKTEWHNIVIHNQALVGICESYLRKGGRIYLEGQLQTRSWEKDGEKRYTTEVVLRPYNGVIVMLSTKSEESAQEGQAAEASEPRFSDDDIPF